MSRVGTIEAIIGTSLPSWGCWALDVNDDVIDYSAGGTWTATIRQRGATVVSSGLTVTAQSSPSGDGSAEADVPSVVVTRTSTALDDLDSGRAELRLTHSSGREHIFALILTAS